MFAYASIRQHTQLHAGEDGLHDVFAFSHHRITVYCPIAQYYNIIISSCFHIVILVIGKQEASHICLLLMIQLFSMTSAHTHMLWTWG